MGHNLQALGTASLDTFGGLVTLASSENLPEGASPRNFDVDFIVGSVFTRPGLSSIYTYSTTFDISSLQIVYNTGTFTYTSDAVPVVNEQLLLQGFTGALTFLNGETVVIESVTSTTFTVAISTGNVVYTLTPGATAISLTGLFVGPNIPTLATVNAGTGSTWVSANNILGATGYASTNTGSSTSSTIVPGAAANDGITRPFSNPSGILSPSSGYATISLGASQTSDAILANAIGIDIPDDAVVLGISITFRAFTNGAAGSSSINVQLAQNGIPIGTALNQPISTTLNTYVRGSAAYQWGTTLTTDIVNGTAFGILIDAQQLAGSGTFAINSLSLTLYYTTSSSSETLDAQQFSFTVPLTSGISGFGVTFQAYSSAATTLSFELLKAGLVVGTAKSQVLDTTPTIYSLGTSNDLWDDVWIASDVDANDFGVRITASGTGTTFINDLDMVTYITPALENFNYIKSFIQNDGQIDTLALDDAGILWKEDVTNNEGGLSVVLTGLLPGSYAKSVTALDQEYMMFSDLIVGTDRPRIYTGSEFQPLSMYAPGGQLSVTPTSNSDAATLVLSSYAVTSNVATFQYTGTQPVAGTVYVLSNIIGSASGSTTDTKLNNLPFVILSAGLTSSQFEVSVTHANLVSTNLVSTATATLAQNFGITSIIQSYRFVSPPPPPTNGGSGTYGTAGTAEGTNPKGQWVTLLQSAGVGSSTPGSVVTVYYANASSGGTGISGDDNLVEQMKVGLPTYVRIAGAGTYNGTWQVTSVGIGIPPGGAGQRYYFTFNFTSSGHYQTNSTAGMTYQRTLAVVNSSTGIPNLAAGGQVTVTGVSPNGWNETWTIVQPLNSGTYDITNAAVNGSGSVATFTYSIATGVAPKAGEIVKVTNTLVNTGSDLNGTYVIQTSSQTSPSGNFTVVAPAGATANLNQTQNNGQAVVYGTQFLIDPGAGTVATTNNPIFGNGGTGTLNVIGTTPGGATQIAAGTRQAVAYFITESGYETGPNLPVVFNVAAGTNSIQVSGIPIGPSNVIARGIAFTEAGQNGVPGANFYVIENDVTQTIGANTTTLAQSTVIRDNTTQSATFSFTDAVLLNSREIDVQGDNLFNLIELGSSAWCIPYANRMFYGLQLNKVQNFNAMAFDSYIVPNQPAGWSAPDSTGSLITSTVTGFAYAINNATVSTITTAGLIQQTAYQDAFGVPIISQNTTYSVRVAARLSTASQIGNLVVDLSDGSTQYGSFTVAFSSMSTTNAVFSGTLLTTPFTNSVNQGGAASIIGSVPTTLKLRLYATNLGVGAGVEIDRVEVYPTHVPYILAQVYGSYINKPESIDASAQGGILDTSSENAQSCMGAFVMHDQMFLLKTSSMYSTEENPNSEPGGWGLHEVSNKVGAIGIHAYDVGEEWAVMACRAGIFGFNGGQPQKMMQEIYQVWDAINWDAGNTIVLRNDIINKRILCAIPLPTGTNPTTQVATKSVKWLPNSEYNPSPTRPNVMLCLNYQGLGTFEELVSQAEMHTTMFGTLAAVDMKRKWTIWQIPSPYMDFITRSNGIDAPLFICNGIASSKVYELDPDQLSDDGDAIHSLYVTYGFVNAEKAATVPIFGYHTKRYTILQVTANGEGTATLRILPNTLDARYPYTVPVGIALSDTEQDDFFRPINVKGNRAFVEVSTNATGEWFNLDKVMITGKADAWSSLNPTGGGNAGISS